MITLRSENGSTPILINFYNASPDIVEVYWLDYEGNEVPKLQLKPEELRVYSTYISHPWRIKNHHGKLLQECVATRDAQTCIIPASLRSLEGTTSMLLTFYNASPDTVALYWLNYQSDEIFYQHLEAGQYHAQQTYISHPWRVKSSDGKVLQELVAVRDSQVIIIHKLD